MNNIAITLDRALDDNNDHNDDGDGKKDKDDSVYRGSSFRRFDRKFTLADDIVVNSAALENGMLTIELERIIPEEKKPRLIEVK